MDSTQVPQDRPIKEITIQALVWDLFACSTAMLEVPAEPLHWIRPVTPHGAPAFDAVCEVEKCVDGESAEWESLGVPLIINSFLCQYIGTSDLRG